MKTINSTEICHIYNRGVEKRAIFLEEQDYARFLSSLHEFNDTKPSLNFGRNLIEVGLQSKEPLVEIYAFCLMPNHYHLMLRARRENGITEFMRKIGTGYTNYFNLKYNRVGHLFQGKYKTKILSKEAHFIHLPYYIHLNPLDLITPNWKNLGINNINKAYDFLKTYRWSSLKDYLGIKNFPHLVNKKLLKNFVSAESLQDYLQNMDLAIIKEIILD